MAYETKPNSGSLFRNDKKETDSHPDYKGSGIIDGVDYWLDSWINTSNAGVKYMSLKFKPKEPRANAGPNYAGGSDAEWKSAAAAATRSQADLDDDVPF